MNYKNHGTTETYTGVWEKIQKTLHWPHTEANSRFCKWYQLTKTRIRLYIEVQLHSIPVPTQVMKQKHLVAIGYYFKWSDAKALKDKPGVSV